MFNNLLKIRFTIPKINNIRYKSYLPKYEWISEHDNIQKIGFSSKTLNKLDEILYLEYSVEENEIINKNEELVVIESSKTVDYINAPFDCKIINLNNSLLKNLEPINKNPECEDNSWILELEKIE